jgi:hypothetical protein
VIPFDRETCKRPQQVGLRAMLVEMLDRLVDQQSRLLLGALRAAFPDRVVRFRIARSTRLEEEVAMLRATLARVMAELGLPPD